MIKFKVIVEKKDVCGDLPKEVPVLMGADHERVIGTANLTKEGEGIMAAVEICAEIPRMKAYPSICYKIKSVDDTGEADSIELLAVAIHSSPNVDPSIPPIDLKP